MSQGYYTVSSRGRGKKVNPFSTMSHQQQPQNYYTTMPSRNFNSPVAASNYGSRAPAGYSDAGGGGGGGGFLYSTMGRSDGMGRVTSSSASLWGDDPADREVVNGLVMNRFQTMRRLPAYHQQQEHYGGSGGRGHVMNSDFFTSPVESPTYNFSTMPRKSHKSNKTKKQGTDFSQPMNFRHDQWDPNEGLDLNQDDNEPDIYSEVYSDRNSQQFSSYAEPNGAGYDEMMTSTIRRKGPPPPPPPRPTNIRTSWSSSNNNGIKKFPEYQFNTANYDDNYDDPPAPPTWSSNSRPKKGSKSRSNGAPPPPPPPPPPMTGMPPPPPPPPSSQSNGGGSHRATTLPPVSGDRSNLMAEIRKGVNLKKSQTKRR